MTTIKEIAKICNLSIATVSKVINGNDHDISEATRQRVLKVVEEKNYRINRLASAMVTKKTKSIGLLIPDITNSFFTDIAQGAEDAASKNNYSIFLCNSYDSLDKEIYYLNQLTNNRVDGIVISGAINRDEKREVKLNINIPILSIDRKVFYKTIDHVSTDNFNGSLQAVNYLAKLGHKNIMFIGGSDNNNISLDRYNGYLEGLRQNNIEFNKNYIRFGQFNLDYGFSSIIENPPPKKVSAIACGNDLIAIGVIYALRKIGLIVPDDISVVGYDDSVFSSVLQPGLTTVSQPSYYMGYLAVSNLIDYLNNVNFVKNRQLDQSLVIRESTKRIEQ